MNGSITAKELGLAHLLIAEAAGVESDIIRTSSLKMLSKQLNGPLREQDSKHRTAFSVFWLARQKPFKRMNRVSAVLLGLALGGVELDQPIASLLKVADGQHGVEEIVSQLR